jgi:hypothetical protein
VRDITDFPAPKYVADAAYRSVAEGVYAHGSEYVTSLSFAQEPEVGEGAHAADISQYPLEDLLDRYSVWVSDFYPAENTAASPRCHLEFAGSDLDDVVALRAVIGRRVLNRERPDGAVELVIE